VESVYSANTGMKGQAWWVFEVCCRLAQVNFKELGLCVLDKKN